MIKIVSEKYIKADCIEQFITLAKELVSCSQAEEGCVSYNLNQAINDSTNFVILESWETMDALDKHKITNHFIRIVTQLNDLCTKPGNVMIYNEI